MLASIIPPIESADASHARLETKSKPRVLSGMVLRVAIQDQVNTNMASKPYMDRITSLMLLMLFEAAPYVHMSLGTNGHDMPHITISFQK